MIDLALSIVLAIALGETRYQSSLQRQSASHDQTISMVSATPIRMTADHKFPPSQSLQIGDFDDKSCSPGIVHCFPCGRSGECWSILSRRPVGHGRA